MAERTRDLSEAAPRRSFFKLLTYLTATAAAVVVAIPGFGYLASATRRKKPPWVTLGPVSAFPRGETRRVPFASPLAQPWDGVVAQSEVYVRNLGPGKNYQDQFLVMSVNCTHLGCAVDWFAQSGLFMCPCHGGVYYENGDRASGPPPRGLYHCVWRVVESDAGQPELQIQAPHLPTLQNTLTDNERVKG